MTGGKSNFDPNSDLNSELERSATPTTTEGGVSVAPPTPCDRVRPELKAYLDGQAGWWRQRSIRAHVAQCPACREEMEAMRDFSDNLRGADAGSLDPALRAKILAAVPHTPPALAEVRPAWRSQRRPLFLAGAAASAALIGAVLYPALNSKNAYDGKPASSETSASKKMQIPAAGAPPNVAPVDTGGSMNTNADTSVDAFAASTKAFRSSPGSVNYKSPAKSVRDVAVSSTPPSASSDITVQVRDVETRSADVEQKALAAGGKIVLSALSTGVDKTPSATLTLKIPTSRLNGFLTQVARLGQLRSRQVTQEDAVNLKGETVKAKERVPHRRQETLVPVTVNLKSSE
jgi:Domain of unknown function (DUF4349)/Putative zinc-finger